MASEADIANTAAVLIGDEARITSLDDNRPVARTLKAIWDGERRAAIRDGAWNFATRRSALAADAAAVPFPYSAAFPVPSDCLRLLDVLNIASRDEYKLEGGLILCDEDGPLYVRYLTDVTELANWDAAAANAFAHRLAWKCGRRIAGSGFDMAGAERAYMQSLTRAKHVDAVESPAIEQDDSSWIAARLGGWGGSLAGRRGRVL